MRAYNMSAQYQGYPLTLEEAIDQAVDAAIDNPHGHSVDIFHERHHCCKVATVSDPLWSPEVTTITASRRRYMHIAPRSLAMARLPTTGRSTTEGPRSVPAEFEYSLHFDLPESGDYFKEHKLPPATVTIMRQDGTVVHEQKFGGEDGDRNCSDRAYRISYYLGLKDKLPKEPGQSVVIRITDEKGTGEKTYCFVTLKEYQATWKPGGIPSSIGQAELAARIEAGNAACNYEQPQTGFASDQTVAAFIDGRWREATYVALADGVHVVSICDRHGSGRWVAVRVKSLEDALTEGLYVVAPYNAQAATGFQATFIGSPVAETTVSAK